MPLNILNYSGLFNSWALPPNKIKTPEPECFPIVPKPSLQQSVPSKSLASRLVKTFTLTTAHAFEEIQKRLLDCKESMFQFANITEKVNNRGFENYSNTCFFNSALKLLLANLAVTDIQFLQVNNNESESIKSLKSAFVNLAQSYHKAPEAKQTTDQALRGLLNACIDCGASGESYVFQTMFPEHPEYFYDDFYVEQQDASEFLGELMRLLKLNEQPEMSVMLMNKHFTAEYAGNKLSRRSEQDCLPSPYLSVNLQSGDTSWQQCIDCCLKEDELDLKWATLDGEKWLLSSVRLDYAVDIDRFKTLNINLSLFQYDQETGEMLKQDAVARKLLDNSDLFITIPVHDKNHPDGIPHTAFLQLNGLILHQGSRVDNGHYTAVINENGQWVSHNDEIVSAIPYLQYEPGTPYVLSFKVIDIVPPGHDAMELSDLGKY